MATASKRGWVSPRCHACNTSAPTATRNPPPEADHPSRSAPGTSTGDQLSAATAARYRAGQSAAVMLCGPVGTGKTRAAFALLNELMHTSEPTPVVRFVDEQTLFEGPHYLAAQTATRFRRDADVLFVDDVGAAASLAGHEPERIASWLAIMKSAAAAPGRFLLVITTNLEVVTPGADDDDPWGWATGGNSLQAWMGEPTLSRMQHLGPYRNLQPATGGRPSLAVSAGNLDWRPALGENQ